MVNALSSNIQDNKKTLVFYDGGCGLCNKEIRHYARLDRAQRLDWIDIGRDQPLLNSLGITKDQAMRRLHVLDRDGCLRDGVNAFVAIWADLPYYRVLARLVQLFKMVPLLESVYRPFATWRYRRRIQAQVCTAPASERIAETLR
ncbi:MAG: DUF393 domain-containing protein [Gammaproteobacteria bacterium]|nr:DUF393 domain-containing protein [Gammaproteobacteria bacterium]